MAPILQTKQPLERHATGTFGMTPGETAAQLNSTQSRQRHA
jgi:hypothetical protein